ncbi:MAG TPA: hypothetical protein VF223_03640 [Trebonia sp.]
MEWDRAEVVGRLDFMHRTLWEDGRCSDMGITPFAPGFAAWYLQWLRNPTKRSGSSC